MPKSVLFFASDSAFASFQRCSSSLTAKHRYIRALNQAITDRQNASFWNDKLGSTNTQKILKRTVNISRVFGVIDYFLDLVRIFFLLKIQKSLPTAPSPQKNLSKSIKYPENPIYQTIRFPKKKLKRAHKIALK